MNELIKNTLFTLFSVLRLDHCGVCYTLSPSEMFQSGLLKQRMQAI